MDQFTQETLRFPPVEGLTVRGAFDGGALSSDFGPLLLRGIDKDEVRRQLMTSLVTFADRMGVLLIAEGIETREELDVLKALGVGYGQGFLFSKPVAPFPDDSAVGNIAAPVDPTDIGAPGGEVGRVDCCGRAGSPGGGHQPQGEGVRSLHRNAGIESACSGSLE